MGSPILESRAKGILNLPLGAPPAGKAFTDAPAPAVRVQHPGPALPGRVVAQVLGVAAGQHRNPVARLILGKIQHRDGRWSGPSVRVAFAFA